VCDPISCHYLQAISNDDVLTSLRTMTSEATAWVVQQHQERTAENYSEMKEVLVVGTNNSSSIIGCTGLDASRPQQVRTSSSGFRPICLLNPQSTDRGLEDAVSCLKMEEDIAKDEDKSSHFLTLENEQEGGQKVQSEDVGIGEAGENGMAAEAAAMGGAQTFDAKTTSAMVSLPSALSASHNLGHHHHHCVLCLHTEPCLAPRSHPQEPKLGRGYFKVNSPLS
jgi:hypothetical protein